MTLRPPKLGDDHLEFVRYESDDLGRVVAVFRFTDGGTMVRMGKAAIYERLETLNRCEFPSGETQRALEWWPD